MKLDSSKEYFMFAFNTTAVRILSAVIATGANAADSHDASQGLTREQVRAEVLAARAAGTLDATEANYPREFPAAGSPLTRAQVKAELLRARAAGEMDWTDATYPLNVQATSHPTRSEVIAEVVRARQAGELDITEATPHGAGGAM